MEGKSIFKPSLGEVKNWLVRLVSEARKTVCETSLTVVKYGFVRLVSVMVENQFPRLVSQG